MQIITNFGLGGAEIMCENLIYEFIKKGHQVIAVSLYNRKTAITERLIKKGVDVRFLDKKGGMDLSLPFKLRKLIKLEQPDVIHTHLVASVYTMPVASVCKKSRKVHTVHSLANKENTRLGRMINKFFFKHKKFIPVALTEENRKSIVEEYGKNIEATIIHNGINLDKCLPKSDYSTNATFHFLHIGSFKEAKNQSMLLKVFKKVIDEGYDYHLDFVGSGGNDEQKIVQMVDDLKLNEKVTFHGGQDNVYPFLQKADAFVLPSIYEGMPITLIEAMGTGLPIIASNVGGIPDMLENMKTAILIEPTEEELYHSLIKVASNQTLRETLGINALHGSKRFSAEIMAEKYLSIYTGGIT